MAYYHAFGDLPCIPSLQTEDTGSYAHSGAWSGYESDNDRCFTSSRHTSVYRTDLPLEAPQLHPMSNMDRFLRSEAPFTADSVYMDSCYPQGPLGSARYDKRRDMPSYDGPTPYPVLDHVRRRDSPDGTCSSENDWNHSPSDGLSSANCSPVFSHGSLSSGSPQVHSTRGVTSYASFDGGVPVKTEPCITLSEIQQYPDQDSDQFAEDFEAPAVGSDVEPYHPRAVFHYSTLPNGHHEEYEDEGLGESIRDAESVQPYSKEEEADSDYAPTSASKRKTRRFSRSEHDSDCKHSTKRAHNAQRQSSALHPLSASKVTKCRKSRTTTAARAPRGGQGSSDFQSTRPFPCPFALYGCSSNFASKNEWKRHVSTQHVRLGFWRCDLCPTTLDGRTSSYNDFNRKDLFSQHLRRMHAAQSPNKSSTKSPSGAEWPVNEDNLSSHHSRCYKQLRSAPARSHCMICNRTFVGEGSWDERMEHVGRHLEKDRKAEGEPLDQHTWQEDVELRNWLIQEGLIEGDGKGAWRLGTGVPLREVYD